MKKLLIICMALFLIFALKKQGYSQQISKEMAAALLADDTTVLAAQVNDQNINSCYGYYSLLSQSIRANAFSCFNFLISHGANVNKICNGYIPPLMHAAKYGRIQMVKELVAKGADIGYKYSGSLHSKNGPEDGETPVSYAEKYGHEDIADFLRSVIGK